MDVMSEQPIRPLGSRALVQQIEANETYEGSELVIPAVYQERPPEGVILRVGPEVKELKPGDRVIFRKWSTRAFVDHESKLIVMEESEALAVRE